jgi:hypothetical protein
VIVSKAVDLVPDQPGSEELERPIIVHDFDTKKKEITIDEETI